MHARLARTSDGVALGAALWALCLWSGSAFANRPPDAPTWIEPAEGSIVSPFDPHLHVHAFSDSDGDSHYSSDFEIWDDSLGVRVWANLADTALLYHVHFGDGVTEGPLEGMSRLEFNRAYRVRARFRDDSGHINSYSDWSVWVGFRTSPAELLLPMTLDDIVPIVPTWQTEDGEAVDLPPGAVLRFFGLDQHLYRINGHPSSDEHIDFSTLESHRPVKVVFGAGVDNPFSLPPTVITVVDEDSISRAIFLPEVDLAGNESVAMWVDHVGRSYWAGIHDTVPDFSDLAQDLMMTWTITEPGFTIERVASDLQFPVNIGFVPNPGERPADPLFYVTELYGKVKVVTRSHWVFTYGDSLLNFDPNHYFPGQGEIGLTGICVEPETGDLFVAGVYDSLEEPYNRVMRLYSAPSGLLMDSMRVILSGIPSGPSHQIQQITIGPDDKLYVQVGDSDTPDTTIAQNPNDLRGKVLRINQDGSPPGDNPYGPTSKVWAVGLRNPFGGTWRGNQLFVTDNGFQNYDRIARVLPGGDYGWCCDITQYALRLFDAGGITAIASAPPEFAGPDYAGDLFVAFSGATYAQGRPHNGKFVRRIQLNLAGVVTSDSIFLDYVGAGYATVVGFAFGPDGAYFTDLYGDAGMDYDALTHANVYKISRTSLATSVGDAPRAVPIALDAVAFPNPTRGETSVRFALSRGGRVSAIVYDAGGRFVATVHDGWLPAGLQALRWDGRTHAGERAASGVHLIRIKTEDGQTRSARVTLLR